MSDTPRTDSWPTPKHGFVSVEFARQLEREMNRMHNALAEIKALANQPFNYSQRMGAIARRALEQ
jgi:hypothetical protein